MTTQRLLDFLGQGDAASRPVAATLAAEIPTGGAAVYYAYDTGVFNFLDTNAIAWVELDVSALSALGFGDLADVDFAIAPTNGQVAIYDSVSATWKPGDQTALYTDTDADARVAAGIATHEAALDPHPGYLTPTEGDSAYAPIAHVGSGGASHADVVAAGASGFMTGADKTKLDGIAAGATAYDDADADARIAAASINALSDVDTATDPPLNGEGLIWDSVGGKWVPGAAGGGGSIAAEDEGIEVVASVARINFTGAGVTVTDSGAGEIEVNIPGSGGGGGMPTIVQSKIAALANIGAGITLDAAPTEGNILVAFTFNSVSANLPGNSVGWTSLIADGNAPDHLVNWRTVGAGESATQNPTTMVEGGIIAIYEIEGTVAATGGGTAATNSVFNVNFGLNAEYLASSTGLGLVYCGRRLNESGAWSGSFADDLSLFHDGSISGGATSLLIGKANVPLKSNLTATCTWTTSIASKHGFVLIA